MKNSIFTHCIFLTLIIFLYSFQFSNAQLLYEDVDGFTTGNLGTQGGWVPNNSGGDVQIGNASPITFDGYNGGDEEYIIISSTDGIDPHKEFTSLTSSTKIWFSFLINVSSASSAGAYFITLRNTDNTNYFSRIYIKDNSGTSFSIGTHKVDGTPVNYGGAYNYNETYLFVARYDWNTETNSDDNFYLWINPDITSEPSTSTADYSITGSSDNNFGAVINSIMVHQVGTDAPTACIDALRLSANPDASVGWDELNCHAKNFYSKSSVSNLNYRTSWGCKTNGRGSKPANFTRNGITYHIRNASSFAIDNNWSVSGTNSKVITGNGTNACTFTIPTSHTFSGTIDVSASGTLKIENTSIPSLGILSEGSILEYAGSSLQSVSSKTYSKLYISNSNGVNLSGNVTVNSVLSLNNGLISLGNNYLTLGSSASVSGTPSSSKMVVTNGSGELRKMFSGTGSFTFPVGDNNDSAEYSPAVIDFTSGSFSSAYVGIKVVNSKHPDNNSVNDWIDRYWTVTQSGISGYSCNVSFYFTNDDVHGSKVDLWCGRFADNTVYLMNAVIASENKLYGTVSNFGDFTGGEQGALPVALKSFSSSVNKNTVLLNWKTSFESDCKGFEIYRLALKSNEWSQIGFVESKGNSGSLREYLFEDKNLNAGKYKYRLKQIDQNGNFENFELGGIVEISAPSKFELYQNYPNPFNSVTQINYTLPFESMVSLIIYDISGREIKRLLNNENINAGYHIVTFDGLELSSGIYLYKIITPVLIDTKRMILIK